MFVADPCARGSDERNRGRKRVELRYEIRRFEVICRVLLKPEQAEVASDKPGQPLSMAFGCMRRQLAAG